MIGWHHRLNGHEFEQVLGDGEGHGSLASMGSPRVGYGQGSLMCCSPWVHKELDTTE